MAQSIADRLEPFAPETDAARASLVGQLAPALDAVLAQHFEAMNSEPPIDAPMRLAGRWKHAERDLAAAQELLTRRDPLIAAKWFARGLQPSRWRWCRRTWAMRVSHQANASVALSRAWDQSIHKAASERLASLPSFSAVLACRRGPCRSIQPATLTFRRRP